MNKQPKLYLMLGYPGAGKTTTAQMIAELTDAIVLTSDNIRIELFPEPRFTQQEHDELYKELDARTEELLKSGKSVIYDANLNRYIHRKEKYDICERVGAIPVLIWLKTPRDLSKTRAVHDSRQHLWPKDEEPAAMFERLVDVFEPPEPDEHPVTLNGSKLTKDEVKTALQL